MEILIQNICRIVTEYYHLPRMKNSISIIFIPNNKNGHKECNIVYPKKYIYLNSINEAFNEYIRLTRSKIYTSTYHDKLVNYSYPVKCILARYHGNYFIISRGTKGFYEHINEILEFGFYKKHIVQWSERSNDVFIMYESKIFVSTINN